MTKPMQKTPRAKRAAEYKQMAFETAIRNPERYKSILQTVAPFKDQILNDDVLLNIVSSLYLQEIVKSDGVPIDENMQYAGSFFTLLTPFTLLTGVMFGLLFLYHGAVFLQLKVGEENLLDKINRLAPKLGVSMIVVTVIWVIFAFLTTGLFDKSNFPAVLPVDGIL